MSVTRKTDFSSDPSSGSLLYLTIPRPAKNSAKYEDDPKSAEDASRKGKLLLPYSN